MASNQLTDNQVVFSLITKEDNQYLVCAPDDNFSEIRFILDLESGKRIVPTKEQKNEFQEDTDGLVQKLIDQF